ncbi:MAG: c-type cytochrome [Myxococcales bacterium]|nr:c-type cytochrome [Myxococcales bacterium]
MMLHRSLCVAALLATACQPVPTVPFGTSPPSGTGPIFGRTIVADRPPPPISGGTLAITSDARTAIAADPDRDSVWIVDIAAGTQRRVQLQVGDEPGRVAIDGAGRAHVALRNTQSLAVIDIASASLVERREACAAPRGVAFQSEGNLVHVACASGELVTLDAATGARSRTLRLADDLRDVFVLPGGMLGVTRFRTAEALMLNRDGTVARTVTPPRLPEPVRAVRLPDGRSFTPTENFSVGRVAWRTTITPTGDLVMLHQRAITAPLLPTAAQEYYDNASNCRGSVSQAAVTRLSGSTMQPVSGARVGRATLAVDVAVSSSGEVAVIAPGDARMPGGQQVVFSSLSSLDVDNARNCLDSRFTGTNSSLPGQATAGAWVGNDVLVQLREPAALVFAKSGRMITLPGESREDTGHQIFHSNSGVGIACATCHAEGGDDAHTWNFGPEMGQRRTQALRGGLLGTEPFHWGGELRDMNELMGDTFNTRMRGPVLQSAQVAALGRFIDRIPKPFALRPMTLEAERGRALFHDATVGCAGCHSGRLGTNSQTTDVGTGMALQVPALTGIAWRAPYMHDGCAPTLLDRFTNTRCGGGDRHGRTSHLSPSQLSDLVAFMQTM